MKPIAPTELTDNFIRLIGKDFMLISAGTPEKFNAMTASWGTVGFLWNKPVATCFVRPERYTDSFMQAQDVFTLSFLKPEISKAVHKSCGSKSGRDTDKIKAAGLTARFNETGGILFD